MHIPSIESRRSEVHKLLRECFNEKVLYGGAHLALEKAKCAYALAHENPSLPSPWPELAAYRLAHLKLRGQDEAPHELDEIDRLFTEASSAKQLGPLPVLYHLAVLHRLEIALPNGSKKKEVSHRIKKTLDRAREVIHDYPVSSMGQNMGQNGPRMTQQSAAFNLLELAAYFLGSSYAGLEGIDAFDPLVPPVGHGWFIVGRNIKPIMMTEDLARWEFTSRAKTSGMLLVELSANISRIKKSEDAEAMWQDISDEMARLLLRAVGRDGLTNIRQEFDTEGTDEEARFRKLKQRTKEKLQMFLKRPTLEVFVEGKLSEEISLLGLVENSMSNRLLSRQR